MGMTYKKIAGAFLCFNRPEYTDQVLTSIENAEEANEIDWFVFQDGIQNNISGNIYAEEDDILKVRERVNNSTLPIKRFKQNSSNLSIALQKHKAHKLFKQYDLVYFFEDDLVISKYYLRLLRVLAEQFPNDMGMMNTHPDNTKKGLNEIHRCSIARIWGYYMNRQVFNKIKEEYGRFAEEIGKIDYNIKWQTKGVRYIVDFPWKCHDITVSRLVKNSGSVKWWPRRTRGVYIGEYGAIAYRDPEKYKRKGFHNQPTLEKINSYQNDGAIEEFVVR